MIRISGSASHSGAADQPAAKALAKQRPGPCPLVHLIHGWCTNAGPLDEQTAAVMWIAFCDMTERIGSSKHGQHRGRFPVYN